MKVPSSKGFAALLGKAADAVNCRPIPAGSSQPGPTCSITALIDGGPMTTEQLRHVADCGFCARRANALKDVGQKPGG